MASKIIHLRNIKRALDLKPTGETIDYILSGRIDNFRCYKSFHFIDLIDGSSSSHLQVVVKKNLLKKPELGSYLVCRGNIVASPGIKQSVEFKVKQLDFVGSCPPDRYPLATANKVKLSDGWFRQNLHLRSRTHHFASLLRVKSELELGLHMIFKQMDYIRVHAPVLTGNDSEASSNLFEIKRSSSRFPLLSSNNTQFEEEIEDSDHENGGEPSMKVVDGDYFSKEVFLNTSSQLHLESLAASLSRVYCLSPAFRAESSLSQRHLCEFLMIEAEEANLTRLEPLMDRVESIMKFCAQYLMEVSEFRADFASLLDKYSNSTIYEHIARSNYVRMTYAEAVKILEDLYSKAPLSGDQPNGVQRVACHYGCDINRWHERQLLNYCNNVPIFITHYPSRLKPFYMKRSDNARDEALNFDLIAPLGGEICGGSLREDNLEALRENLKSNQRPDGRAVRANENNAPREPLPDNRFQWYLDLREFGTFPHGGFGIGFERMIQALVGVNNIKDTVAFPRWRGHCPM